jgi:ABC-type tungstate transport system permease subunit
VEGLLGEAPMQITSTYTTKKWDERPYEIIENRMKSTKATVEFVLSGDIEGTASTEYLMFYSSFDPKDPHQAKAQYVGLMRITGKLKDKSGSFTLIDNGTFASGAARSKVTIVPESGTGELSKISGGGVYRADQDGCSLELDVSI